MKPDQILDELRHAMASLFELEAEDITRASRLGEDLVRASIYAIVLVITMQELSGDKIDQESMNRVRTIGDIVDLVEEMTARSSS